ncbi:Predicted arabinose efflux permease, MFS family [Hydrobacter penzbergensis]|jgi:MFS family permease|uniref:Predicted arabinose efflux permease, MFS family n=1 Tax=Hydrobacter penzbergensis TaxID=1235997 RepID=A0A8X8LDI5_9BACT|nr:MFS transporter [Hydrobacter penzbergensis]PQV61575.1 putative MFS family arabinose efflux permease [Sediminibacterium magnilacihabitans]SDW15259.1 Predicted arabinose efflux permease, MFS family [Hydrobacter penzbergensis]
MQGLRENRNQFYLLVLINAFVGSMVGLERSVLPGLSQQFSLSSYTAMLSFLVSFGSSKAVFNLLTGKLTKTFSRKTVLLIGWIVALPVPFLLMYAPDWNWIIAANVLLGINQGLAWSSTVIMKIDLVGERNRGLAMGINEFAGYLSVGLAAYLASEIAADKGFAYYPFLPGIFFSMAGLFLTLFFVKDTTPHVVYEAAKSNVPYLKNIWEATTLRHHNLGSVTINGFINNLNDGVIWGLLPVLLLGKQFTLSQTGFVAGVYPAVWGIAQLVTGKLGDRYCKKQLIISGMLVQAAGLTLLAFSNTFSPAVISMLLLGLGTALVYPNFLTVVAENTHPHQRAESLSIFRFWRDSGYVIGALLSGILADAFGIVVTLLIVAMLTALAGLLAQVRMCCTARLLWKSRLCTELT